MPKKKKRKLVASSLFCGSNSETVSDPVDVESSRIRLLQEKAAKKAEKEIERQKNEDPTMYEYDEVYDEVSKVAKKENNDKSLLVENMKKNAEHRKFMFERAQDRLAHADQIELEAKEGKATEVFVTSAYKARLAERNEWQKKEDEKLRLEQTNDVTKIGNMTSFYSDIITQLSNTDKNDTPQPSQSLPTPSISAKTLDTAKLQEESIQRVRESESKALEERKISDKLEKILKQAQTNSSKPQTEPKLPLDIIEAARIRARSRRRLT